MWNEDEILYLKNHYAFESWENMLNNLPYTKEQIMYKAKSIPIRREIRWISEDDKEWIKKNYKSASWEDIKNRFPDKNKDWVKRIASDLNIKRDKVPNSSFTKEEDEIILNNYQNMTDEQIHDALLPHRTTKSITMRRCKHLMAFRRLAWTAEEDKIIIEHYFNTPRKEIAAMFPERSAQSVYLEIDRLGLKGAKGYKYNPEDYEFVIENYQHLSDKEIGEHLHRTAHSIKELRRKIGAYRQDKSKTHYGKDIDRFLRRNNLKWKAESMKRCNYKCFITGEEFDDIHHLYGENLILQNVMEHNEIAKDVIVELIDDSIKENLINDYQNEHLKHPYGLCLSKRVHKEFHNIYGYGNNTVEQFVEFVKNRYPCKLDELKEYIKKNFEIVG